ncbi:MAG TPA: ZIP family zinc transporter [Actinobacteria bacterium]|jgi:ZIP family zinc transporter|nr:ZIP family zinc transporter [Actinomycetota bacterium]
MLTAAFWALIGSGALVVGALLGFWLGVSRRTLGLIMGFGAGTLLSAVSFDLVFEAFKESEGLPIVIGLLAGAFAFWGGDILIERMQTGKGSTPESGDQDPEGEPGSGLQLALGATLDGVPESVAIGLTLLGGNPVSLAFVIAVFLSNVPEGMAASVELARTGYSKARILGIWGAVVVLCVVAAAVGYVALGDSPPSTIALIQSFAAGSILAMLAITMMPQAFSKGGRAVGIVTVVGFILAAGLSAH